MLHRIAYARSGGIFLSFQGYVIARVYTSDAILPLAGAAVSFTQSTDGQAELLAIRYTDLSGLTAPVYVDTPEPGESLSPGSTLPPFSTVELLASLPGYSSLTVRGVQVFPGVETIQPLPLRPVPASQREDGAAIEESAQEL